MRLLIISRKKSELARLLKEAFPSCDFWRPGKLPKDLDRYDAFALIGGVDALPLELWADEREALERQLKRGAKFFVEYTAGLWSYDAGGTTGTRYARPVMVDAGQLGTDLRTGALLDEQSNDRILPRVIGRSCVPILQYSDYPKGFYYIPEPEKLEPDESRFAMWLETPGLLVCSFRMANFASAKFAPQRFWAEMILSVIRWLGGECTVEKVKGYMDAAYHLNGMVREPMEVAREAVQWFRDADMLVMRGGKPYGVKESLSAHVKADGTHVVGECVRNDCTGQTALMYYLKGLVDDDEQAMDIADSLRRFPLDAQRKSGPYAGFVSGSNLAYFVSYQDDIARGFLLPELYRAMLSGDHSYLPNVKLTLDYLLSTTGTDGLRMCRVDYIRPDGEELSYMGLEQEEGGKWHWNEWVKTMPDGRKVTAKELRDMPSGCPSVHYNGTYMASLLLYGKLTGEKSYIAAGEKGMATLMSGYPITAREHSQTQEICRLILPLAILHWVTEDPEKKNWLYQVTEDLMALRHPNGGFREWDEGYIACCAGTEVGEASVLAENGDPVADMMYSLEWLSMGTAMARMITRNPKFDILWKEIAGFYSRTQIVSGNKLLNGAWPRSVDLDHYEVYGVPNDWGWAPWTIESGWTVTEIASGLMLNEIFQRREMVSRL